MKQKIKTGLAGLGAGAVNGLFGAGGGMVLVPLLSGLSDLDDEEIFPASVCVILPLCVISLLLSPGWGAFHFSDALPYLFGSVFGGVTAGFWGKHIPTLWLHRGLGALIIWGGLRYLI